MFDGLLDLPWWGLVLVVLALTHVTIASVTIFLHRHQAHRALELSPPVSHFFRFWLWLTTGMVTREWIAIHRKHHAKCETADDPHSPQILGIRRVLFGGAFLYRREALNRETIERYGKGAPDDWLERNLYARYNFYGILLMLLLDGLLFGIVPGVLVWLVQMVWIPFWAAGVINGLGHFRGYRNFDIKDASTNLVPWGIIIGGEELHNNHHTFVTSARLSYFWYEFDIGWLYIRILQGLGLARVKSVSSRPKTGPLHERVDFGVLQAVINNRHDIFRRFAQGLRVIYGEELARHNTMAATWKAMGLKRWIGAETNGLPDERRVRLEQLLVQCPPLKVAYAMREELAKLWESSSFSREQRIGQLQDWCQRAERSGIAQLALLSRRLRSYVPA